MQSAEVTPLLPAPAELTLELIVVEPAGVTLIASARRPAVQCPACGCASRRVHGRYERTLLDLPWHGLAVRLRVRARRFRCTVPGCARRIFCERLPGTARPHARRTRRAGAALEEIGLALGGEAGARLAWALGLATSADTLLRLLKAEPAMGDGDPARPRVRVLGVDDWAWRRGQRYGTILCDLERGRVVDLLPDREPGTLAAWLRAHPGAEVVTRDRSPSFADAIARGAPGALQVADRFHLLCNLTATLEQLLERRHTVLRSVQAPAPAPAPPAGARPGSPAAPPARLSRDERRKAAVRERRTARYERIVELHAKGLTSVAIAREVGLVRQTVRRWVRAGGYPERRAGPPRRTLLDPHEEYLRARWADGCHNATRLWRELCAERGFRGGRTTVRDWVLTRLRSKCPRNEHGCPPAGRGRAARPSPRRTAWLLTAPEERLTPEHRRYLDALCAASEEIARVRHEAHAFAQLFRDRDGDGLTTWLAAAAGGPLSRFAAGLRKDEAAVRAAVTSPWSNGPAEGQVNRLKLLKRTMYGRASFALLRRRVLAA